MDKITHLGFILASKRQLMAFHNKLKQLRIEKDWTQANLAEKLDIQQKQISSYERGASKPSTDILIKIAEIFEVSLDYLVFEIKGENAKINVRDRELLRAFETIDSFEETEKRLTKEMLGLVIAKHQLKELANA